ncbi:YezD family protein [bacterium]|nr:YezD family protein [bacterium]MCI0607277.1 YezD family protein [bacterium]
MDHRNTEIEQQQYLEILRAVKKIQYGSVEIVIHDSKIVQIETREKVRFEKQRSVK